MRPRFRQRQQGVMLLEALIAILIFSVGILALVAMQGLAINYTSEAKYRSDASFLASEIISQIWVDRGNLANYAYPGGTAPELANWVTKINNTLPQGASNPPTITVDTATGTIDVTVRWLPPNAEAARNYRTIAVVTNP